MIKFKIIIYSKRNVCNICSSFIWVLNCRLIILLVISLLVSKVVLVIVGVFKDHAAITLSILKRLVCLHEVEWHH